MGKYCEKALCGFFCNDSFPSIFHCLPVETRSCCESNWEGFTVYSFCMIMSVVLLLGGYLSGGWTELIGRRRRGKGEIFWAHKNTYIGLGHTLPTTKQQFLTFLGIFPEIHSIWLASWSRSDRPTIDRRLKSAITKEQSILFLTLSFPHVQYMSMPKIWVFPRVLFTQLSYL